jgi:hypothetical protein
MDLSDPILFQKIDDYLAFWKGPQQTVRKNRGEDETWRPNTKPDATVKIPKHIYDRPEFRTRFAQLLKEENSEGLKFPHTLIVGGSIGLVGDTLLTQRQSIAENFAGDPLCDLITGAYTLALSQLKLQTPEPLHRLECLLTVTAATMMIDWRTRHINLPAGFDSLADFEQTQAAKLS